MVVIFDWPIQFLDFCQDLVFASTKTGIERVKKWMFAFLTFNFIGAGSALFVFKTGTRQTSEFLLATWPSLTAFQGGR